MAHLLLLEDEAELREELVDFLVAQGHIVSEAGNINAFQNRIADPRTPVDIAIIDRGLPDGDGLDLVASLRRQRADIGLVMFTARATSHDKVLGFSLGADHYLTKPVRLDELAAVVNALQRRLPAPSSWRLRIGAHRLALPSGIDVPLTSLEFVFLKTMAEGQGQPVSRKRIVAAFGDDYLTYDQRRLDSMVRRLRQKVLHETSVVLPVNTYHGVGYGFTAELTIEP
jgi:DNA-binding response OmpR family regulator